MRGRLTRAGVGAVLIALLMLAAGLMKTINLLILLGDLLLILIVINAYLARRSTRALSVFPDEPRDYFAGGDATRNVTIANDTKRTHSMTIREVSSIHDVSAFVAAIPPSDSQRIRFTFRPTRRGVHPVATSFSSGYPFGFVAFDRRLADCGTLTVFPALGRVDREAFRRWLVHAGSGDTRSRRSVSQQPLHLADIRGVRPFRSGESRRHIHWRTTARRNELMVRDYDSPDALDLVLLVEPWLPAQATEKDRQRLEETLSLAATLIHCWCDGEQSPRITFVLPDVESFEGRASPHLARRVFRALAGLTGGTAFRFEPKSPSLHSPRAVRLLVSSRPEPGPLPQQLRDQSGRAWQRLSPGTSPAWYHPPQPSRE